MRYRLARTRRLVIVPAVRWQICHYCRVIAYSRIDLSTLGIQDCLSMRVSAIAFLLLTTATLSAQSTSSLKIRLDTNRQPVLTLSGRLGETNEVQFTDTLGGSNQWQTLTNLVPKSSEAVIFDSTASAQGSRFYRAVAQVGLTLEAALDGTEFAWTSGGDAPWFAQTNVTIDGVDAAQSGTTPPGGTSWLEATVSGPGTIEFWWNMAAGPSDTLRFYVFPDGVTNSLPVAGFPGTQGGWQRYSLDLPGGTYLLRWNTIARQQPRRRELAGPGPVRSALSRDWTLRRLQRCGD